MSVTLRGKKWHYRFSCLKKNYNGVCVDCVTKKQAEEYEANIKKEVESLRHHKTVASLVEDYRKELAGGKDITLVKAFDLALAKPSKNAQRSTRAIQNRKGAWSDFSKYIVTNYPSVKHIDEVTKPMCEAYFAYIIENGRFDKMCSYVRQKSKRGLRQTVSEVLTYEHNTRLKPRTISDYASAVKWVFSALAEDAGIHRNPMDGIILPGADDPDRDIFTEEELTLIREGIKHDDICRPLFTVAAMTGLTEGDICTLKWSQLDFRDMAIRRRRNKTGAYLEIPIGEGLANFFLTYPKISEYVFPELEELYRKRDVSPKIKKFLNSLGIENTKKEDGYRAVSTKDLHSMRHVFCFYAGQAGIPITTVQSIVGHMTEEMTRHYSRHDTLKSKQQAIERLPGFLSFAGGDKLAKQVSYSEDWDDTSEERHALIKLAKHLPISEVKEILKKYQ